MTKLEDLQEMKKGIVTPEQAAEILGVSINTLEKWRWTGRYGLPFFKVGSKVRYRADDLKAFMERGRSADPMPSRPRRNRKAA